MDTFFDMMQSKDVKVHLIHLFVFSIYYYQLHDLFASFYQVSLELVCHKARNCFYPHNDSMNVYVLHRNP